MLNIFFIAEKFVINKERPYFQYQERWYSGEVATIRDFDVYISLLHSQAIQSDNWGMGRKVSMEGVIVYFSMHGIYPIIYFHTYLSYSTDQSSETVYNHIQKRVKQ